MSQTKTGSFVEATSNLVVGFALNWVANIVLLPILWDPQSPKLSAFYIGIAFTLISFARQWVLRRRFNAMKFGNTAEPT